MEQRNIIVHLSSKHFNFRVREFCEDNRLKLKKHEHVAICPITNDVYRFMDLSGYRAIDKIRGMYIDQLICLDRLGNDVREFLPYVEYMIQRTRQVRAR